MRFDRPTRLALGLLGAAAFATWSTQGQAAAPQSCSAAPVFWLELSRLCQVTPALTSTAEADSDAKQAAAAALGYCQGKSADRFVPPVFAGQGDSERAAVVQQLAQLTQAPRPPEPTPAEARSALIDMLLSDRLNQALPKPGPGAELVIGQFVSTTCATTSLSQWLPETCTASGDVRQRLVRDVLGFTERQLAAAPGADSGIAAAILVALTSPDPVRGLIEHFASASPALANGCAPPLPEDDSYRIVAALLLRLESEAKAGATFSPAELRAILLFELDRLRGRVPNPVSPLRQRAADRLVTAWNALLVDRQSLAQSPDLSAVLSALDHLVALAESATTLATDKPQRAPAELSRLLAALHQADGQSLLSAAHTLAQAAGVATVPEEVVKAAETGLRLMAAKSREEAERILRGVVLGRWSERVIFDIGAGVPVLTSKDMNVNGDLTLGYHFDHLGLMAYGALATYDVSTPDAYDEMTRMGGGADIWYASSANAPTRFELRARGELQIYDSTTVVVADGNSLSDQTSMMVRGEMTAALRLEPPANWALGVWLGAGAQLESYNATRIGGVTVDVDDHDNTSVTATGRVRGEWAIVPDYLALRLKIDGQYYRITRDSIGIRASTLSTNVALLGERADQVDLTSRGYADIELLSFFGFVPGVFGGVDYTYRRSTTVDVGSYTPVFGAGVRRASF
jgi:hypothetical protein